MGGIGECVDLRTVDTHVRCTVAQFSQRHTGDSTRHLCRLQAKRRGNPNCRVEGRDGVIAQDGRCCKGTERNFVQAAGGDDVSAAVSVPYIMRRYVLRRHSTNTSQMRLQPEWVALGHTELPPVPRGTRR